MEAERRTGVDDMSAEADELVACVRMETGLCHRHVYIVQPSTGRWKEVAHIHCSRRSRRSRRRRRSSRRRSRRRRRRRGGQQPALGLGALTLAPLTRGRMGPPPPQTPPTPPQQSQVGDLFPQCLPLLQHLLVLQHGNGLQRTNCIVQTYRVPPQPPPRSNLVQINSAFASRFFP